MLFSLPEGGGGEDEYSSSDDGRLVNGADGQSFDDWVPSRSYEDYMAKVMKDLGEHCKDGEENG